jgi:hypothetical protein
LTLRAGTGRTGDNSRAGNRPHAGIDGTGSANQPLGVLRTSGIGNVIIAASAGGAPTYAKIVDLETTSRLQTPTWRIKFLTTPTMRGRLRQARLICVNQRRSGLDSAGTLGVGDVLLSGIRLTTGSSQRKVSGTNSDCHAIIFGYWPTIMIGVEVLNWS